MRLADRTVLVTGAALGIGRAMAQLFAGEGARVAIVDRLADEGAALAAELEAGGGRAIAVAGDVTSSADVERAFASAEQAFGGVDVLVNNAYSCVGDSVVRMDEETWDADLRGTLTSACCTGSLGSGGGGATTGAA